MALVSYDPLSSFQGSAKYAVHRYIGALFGQPMVAEIEDWMGVGKFTREVPGSKLINDINIPISEPGMQRFDGVVGFEEASNIFVSVRRGTYRKGAKTNKIKAAEVDLNAWSMQPSTMNVEIANNKFLLAVACLNGALTGIPQNASGVALGFPEIIATDQIYGGPLAVLNTSTSATSTDGALCAWVTGTTYAVGDLVTSGANIYKCTTGGVAGATPPSGTGTGISDGTDVWSYVMATPSLKPVNPADTSILNPSTGAAGWFNARQKWQITPDNILKVLKNQQTRCAMNAVELGLGRKAVELWVPYLSEEDARLLVEVMRELAGSGYLSFEPVVVNGNVTAFSAQTNPVYGRCLVKPVHGLRSDMWGIASPPPQNRPEYALFLHAFGGNAGEYVVNPDGFDESANEAVPHIALFTFDQNSAMFFGVPGVSKFGDIGILALLNEGIATQSGLLLDLCYTGAAS
jgi:hypothetical protein